MNTDTLDDNLVFDTPAKPEPKVDTNGLAIRSDIAKVSDVMTEFDKLTAGLDALAAKYPVDLVYDVGTGAGMAEAKEHRAAWRDPRQAVERLRKQAKAPVIAMGKSIDARAEWLTAQLMVGETPIDEQIKAEETRKEADKQARILAEADRVMRIEDAIGEIHMDVMLASSKPSTAIAATIESLRTATLDTLVFQDRMPQAEAARTAGIAKLEIALKARLHDEAVAASLAAERAELADLRAAAAAQKVKDAAAAQVEQARIAAVQAETARTNKIAADEMAAQMADIKRQRDQLEADQLAARNREALAEAARVATAEPIEPAPAPAPAPTTQPAALVDVQMLAPAKLQPVANEPATLNLGSICARLGFTISGAFVADTLGIQHAATDKAAKLYRESQFPMICAALTRHIADVQTSMVPA